MRSKPRTRWRIHAPADAPLHIRAAVRAARRGWRVVRQRRATLLRTHPVWSQRLAWLRSLLLVLLLLAWLITWTRSTPTQSKCVRAYLVLWRRSPRAAAAHSTRAVVRLVRAAWLPLLYATRRADAWLGAVISDLVASLAEQLRQLFAVLRRDPMPAPLPLELDELEAETSATPMVWEQRLSRGARLARLGVIGGSLCLALFLVTGGPAAALAEWRQVAVALTPGRPLAPIPPHLNASYWIAGRLPNTAIYAHGIQLQPAPGNSQVAYACWVVHADDASHTPHLYVYSTTDGARNWSPVSVPPVPAAACHLATDSRDPLRALLLLIPAATNSCASPRLFATDNGGAAWRPVALPTALLATCELSFSLARGVIYLWSPVAQSQLADSSAAELYTSADDGQNWQLAFDAPARPPATIVTLVAATASGALLVLARPAMASGRASAAGQQEATLWCRASSGALWQSLGALPRQTSSAFVLHDPHSMAGCAFPTVFAAGFLAPDDPIVTRIEVRTAGLWRVLPPLTPDGTAEFPLGDDGDILGVGPGDMLLADLLYAGPEVGSQIGSLPGRAIWGWDLRTGRWLPDFYPTPANSAIEGLAWDYSVSAVAPRLVCWIYTLNAGVPAFTGVLRATFASGFTFGQDASSSIPAG